MTETTVKRGALPARYLLLAAHTILTLGIFLSYLIIIRDAIATFILAISVVGWLIYVPAATILTARDSASGFVSAGGEVAYLVVQWIVYLGAGTLLAIYDSFTLCSSSSYISSYSYTYVSPSNSSASGSGSGSGSTTITSSSNLNPNGNGTFTLTPVYTSTEQYRPLCHAWLAYTVLVFVHAALLIGWMIWVIVAVHSVAARSTSTSTSTTRSSKQVRDQKTISQVYKLASHRVMQGRYDARPSQADDVERAARAEANREAAELHARRTGTGVGVERGLWVDTNMNSGLHAPGKTRPEMQRHASGVTTSTEWSVDKEKEAVNVSQGEGKKGVAKKEEREPEWEV